MKYEQLRKQELFWNLFFQRSIFPTAFKLEEGGGLGHEKNIFFGGFP